MCIAYICNRSYYGFSQLFINIIPIICSKHLAWLAKCSILLMQLEKGIPVMSKKQQDIPTIEFIIIREW